MKTADVLEKIEGLIGRKMTNVEVSEISRMNDEGWPDHVMSPNMLVINSLLEAAHRFGYISGEVDSR